MTSHLIKLSGEFLGEVAVALTTPTAVIAAFLFCGCLCCCGKRKMKQVYKNGIYCRSPMNKEVGKPSETDSI